MTYEEEIHKIVEFYQGQVFGKYTTCHDKLTFKCSKDHTWQAKPRHIKSGRWCPICAIEKHRKYSINHDFFSQDTPKSFYWAGFIAADGWVGDILGIELSIKDINHLEKFKSDIQSNHKIKVFTKRGGIICNNKKPTPSSDLCSIRISSKKIVSDLERFNIFPAKTYKMDIPDWLKEHKLLSHFLRGYIDGDGSFAIAKNKSQDPHITFCMRGTANFLNSFNKIMHQEGIIKSERKELIGICGKKYNAFNRVQYSGNNVISKMYNYLYSDANVFLDRKQEVAIKAKEWAVYNNGNKKKKTKEGTIKVTPEELLELARKHKSQAKVAEELGCTSANISILTKKFGIRKEFSKLIKVSPEEFWKAFIELKSSQKVADKFGCHKTTVINTLKNNNYDVPTKIKYTCNENFFNQDTPESFYWAGFIAADGCLKCRNNRYELFLSLSQKDKMHLEKFKSYIQYDGPIRDYLIKSSKRNPKWNDSWSSQMAITSKQVFNSLCRFNIVPRKSLTYTFPNWMIDHPLVHHFMRGYFDGDGSFYYANNQKYFSLRGTSEFLLTYRNILEMNNLVQKRNTQIRINNKIGVLEYGGNNVVDKIEVFLFKDALVYLNRKWLNS